MRDLPDASGLLTIALKAFEEDIQPDVPPAKRYQALPYAERLAVLSSMMAVEAGETA